MGDKKNAHEISVGKLEEGEHFTGAEGRIILKRILKQRGVVIWTGFMRLKIWESSILL
jgi:hypothetical protein